MPRVVSQVSAAERRRVDHARVGLLAFFDAHKRDLPWRRTRDPFAIWVSEIMLQQTRVETVIPYFERFVARFPTVRALADAPLDAVLSHWAGLGYYRRARMLHAGAQAVTERHGGNVPSERAALEALPGIGAYTAGAIASIAFGRREALVDGNVERVLTRLFALEGNPRATTAKKHLWLLAANFADCERPGAVNEGLMELGATVCTPSAPKCPTCPVRAQCQAQALGDPERFPELPVRKAAHEEHWTALVVTDRAGKRVWLGAATIGRWQGMLLPPMVRARVDDTEAVALLGEAIDVTAHGSVVHVLTHASMRVSVHRGTIRARMPPRGEWVALTSLSTRAVPKITTVVLQKAGLAVRAVRPER